MLGKLIKYEFKATGRSMLPIYLALLVLSIINKIFWGTTGLKNGIAHFGTVGKILGVFAMIIYVMIFIAAMVMTVVIIVQRFYKNLLKDEGYLMNTLPVTPGMNIASKLITALIWTFICSIISIVSIIILAYQPNMIRDIFVELGKIFNKGIAELDGSFILFVIEGIIFMIGSSVLGILMMYASITIGNLAKKNKIIASIGVFVGLNFLLNTVISVVTFSFNDMFCGWVDTVTFSKSDIHIVMLSMILFVGVFSCVFFYIASYIMKNKLNLE